MKERHFPFWLLIVLPVIFQMSDAVFMGLSSEISSQLSLRNEDILYCGFAGMIGVTMTFPILFRLKFWFTSRSSFLIASLGMATLCIACLYVRTVPLLVVMSFLFGVLKLWGSFEAFSSIMGKVAPNFHFAPFLAVVFSVVFGSIELSGIVGKAVVYYWSWRYMSVVMTGALLAVAVIVFFGMSDFRTMPKQTLKGIDWLGMVLWSATLLSIAFICVYGEILDWFHSEYMWVAVGVVVASLGLNLLRMNNLSKPYIEFKAFAYHNVWSIVLLFLIAAVMMSAENVIQHIYISEILGISQYSQISLRVAVFLGVLFGGWFGYYAIENLGIGFRKMTVLSILMITIYEACMYPLISPDTALFQMWVPLFLYGAGHTLIFVVLTTYIEGVVPMEHRFQALSILGFVRIGCGMAFGSAVLGHLFAGNVKSHIALIGSSVDVDTSSHIPFPQLAETISSQAMMVSIRDIYGLLIILGMLTIMGLVVSPFAKKGWTVLSWPSHFHTVK